MPACAERSGTFPGAVVASRKGNGGTDAREFCLPRKAATELVKPVDESELDFEVDPNDPLDDVSGAPGREFKLECMDPTRSYAWAHNTREDIATVMASIPGVAWKVEKYAGQFR